MSESNHDRSAQRDPRRQQVAEAMEDVAHYRRQYLRAAQNNQANHPELRREFHSAVLDYWLALRPFRNNDALTEQWQTARVWQNDDGSWQTGIDSLQNWVNRTKTVSVDTASGYDQSGGETRTVPETLPAKALIRVSLILDDIAAKIDDDQQRPKGRVALPDEHQE